MLSKEHKLLLAQLVYNDRHIIIGELGPNLSKADKQEKWNEIFLKLNAMRANLPDFKTLRDVEWSNMRRAVERKLATIKENENKTEDEKVNVRPFTALEEIILDILGKGNGTTERYQFDFSESGPIFDPAQLARIKFEDDDDEEYIDDNDDSNVMLDSYGGGGIMTRKRRSKMSSANRWSVSGDSELNDLRRKKLRLECSKLELEIERIPLECAKLELQIQLLQRDLLSGTNNI